MNFEINKKGRDFVVGDIHGMYALFLAHLEDISFDREVDRMFSVGDLIDRGPNNLECLKLIEEPWFHSVIGNHEDMMIRVVLNGDNSHHWFSNGGEWCVDAGQEEVTRLAEIADKLPITITVETHKGTVAICHAQPPKEKWEPGEVLASFERETAIWGRTWIKKRTNDILPRIKNIWKTFHGHTPVKEPVELANVNFIDTGAVYTGNLTIVEL